MATAKQPDTTMETLGEGYAQQRNKERINAILFYSGVIATVLFCVVPLLWVFSQSVLTSSERFQPDGTHRYFPSSLDQFTIENYEALFDPSLNITSAILNSFIVSSITTVLCVAIGASASYVLAQFNFRFRTGLLGLILSMTMFPGIVIIVPLFVQYLFIRDLTGLVLINSYTGIIIPYIVFNLPLTVYLLFNFFQEIPGELISAARVDGASDFQIFRKVVLPLAMPGVFTTAILVFIAAWNEFLFASILMSEAGNQTIPVALQIFTGQPPNNADFDPTLVLLAATFLVTIPLIVMVLVFQKQIVSGLTAGAVKG